MIRHKTFRLSHLTTELLTTTLIGLSLLGPATAQSSSAGGPNNGEIPAGKEETDLPNLLPLLLTSPERKQLAENLEASIRRGDLKGAEQSLNTAIEVGTLAIVLVDYLSNPKLLKSLQDLGIRGGTSAPAPKDISKAALPEACAAPATPTPANLAAMQDALEQERSYGNMVSQTLTALMQEHNALVAQQEAEAASQSLKATEVEQALRQEQERSKTIGEELARLQEQYRALQAARDEDKAAAPAKASELQVLLQQEREQSDRAVRQLASVQKELRDLQALKDAATTSEAARVSELEKALARAQMRSDALMQELADAADELLALREPHRSGPTPLVFRLASTGVEPSLTPQDAPMPEALSPPPAEANPPPAVSRPEVQDITSALPGKEPAAVMIAALPGAIQPLPKISSDQPKAEPPVRVEPKADPATEAPRADDRLVARADELFRKGDVSGARLLLEHALASGNARAAFLLGETFDPNVLAKMGALGIRGDTAKAREFYAQARALGMVQAGERMEALK
jgi:hypothetical protein